MRVPITPLRGKQHTGRDAAGGARASNAAVSYHPVPVERHGFAYRLVAEEGEDLILPDGPPTLPPN